MHETGRAVNPQQMGQRGDSAISLHIEELVLHNFVSGDRHAMATAFQRELERLFAAEGVPAGLMQSGSEARLDGGAFSLPYDAAPEVISAHLARAVYHSLSGFSDTNQAPGGGRR